MNIADIAAEPDVFESAMAKVARAIGRQLEAALRAKIEQIEGRLPPPSEISQFLVRGCFQYGREEWKWRGQTIVTLEPPTLDHLSWRITY